MALSPSILPGHGKASHLWWGLLSALGSQGLRVERLSWLFPDTPTAPMSIPKVAEGGEVLSVYLR